VTIFFRRTTAACYLVSDIQSSETSLRRKGATWCVLRAIFRGSFKIPFSEADTVSGPTIPDAVHMQYEHRGSERSGEIIQEEDKFLQPEGYGPETKAPVTVKRMGRSKTIIS